MKLSTLDISIVGVYLLVVIVVGFVMKKRASKSIKSYFLGGNILPGICYDFPMPRGCSIYPARCGWERNGYGPVLEMESVLRCHI